MGLIQNPGPSAQQVADNHKATLEHLKLLKDGQNAALEQLGTVSAKLDTIHEDLEGGFKSLEGCLDRVALLIEELVDKLSRG